MFSDHEPKQTEKLIDILNAILKGNPINSFKKLLSLTVEPHLYLDQWKTLDVSVNTLEKVIDITRRYEENGLQLEGKGVWLLLMCLKYCYNPTPTEDKLSKDSQISLVETLFRIALEHSVQLECTEILQYIVDKMELTPKEVFEAGISIADQLPNVIECDNFGVVLRFCVNCIRLDSRCFLQASRFLLTVVPNVSYDYKSNYYLERQCTVLVKAFDSEYIVTESIFNSTELQTSVLKLLTSIVGLNPLHPQHIANTTFPAEAVKVLITTASLGTILSEEEIRRMSKIKAASCHFLQVLCQDPMVCAQLREMVSRDALTSHLTSKDPLVLEAVAGLFLSLNAQEFDYLYPGRPVRSSRPEIVFFLKTLLETALEVTNEALAVYANEEHQEKKPELERADSHHPPPMVEHSAVSSSGSSKSTSSSGGEGSNPSAFTHVNHILELVDHHVKLNQVNELFPAVDAILHLLLLQTQDFSIFNIAHVDISDSVILLLGKKERCWWPSKEDPLDTDFQNVSTDLVAQFSRVTASNKLFDTNDMKTLNYLAGTEDGSGVKHTISKRTINSEDNATSGVTGLSLSEVESSSVPSSSSSSSSIAPINNNIKSVEQESDMTEAEAAEIRALEEAAMLHLTANMKFCTTQFITSIRFLKGFLLKWEAEDVQVTCRKLVLVFLIAGINGTITLQPVLGMRQLEDVLWELLNEARLGLGTYPKMQRKCIQLLTYIAIEGETGLGNTNDIAEYVLKILITREENNHDLPLMYSCLSLLLALADRERTVRRKVITYFGRIYEVFEALDPVDSLSPLLHLAGEMLEFLTKLELDGEQCLVTLILRALLTRNKKVRVHACDLICAIGGASPGIIHRGIGRREVEDVLVSMLMYENIAHNPAMILSVLKACNVFVHDVNLKPYWLPNPWGYHWSDYKSDLSSRPMLNSPFIDVLLNVMHRAPPSYRMIYFSICLSIASSLMYNCSDGIVNPSNKLDVANLSLLKDSLVTNILPWLPIAVDFITIGKKNIGVNKPPVVTSNVRAHKRGSLGKMLDSTKKQLDQIAANLVKKQLAVGGQVDEPMNETIPAEKTRVNSGGGKPNRFRFLSGASKDNVSISTGESPKGSNHGSQNGDEGGDSDSNHDKPTNGKKNLSMEFLTEKTVDGLYSFLCMDEMFPLSTYLRNVGMFQRTPVIACVSYFMTENKTNLTIQRRGIDFIKYFTDNQIGLSSIAMHSPSALICATRALHDVLDVQYSFCRIITAVSQSDDFARDNLIRFQVHMLLTEILLRQHPEQSRLACMAVTELASSDLNVISMCQSSGLVESIVAVMDALPADLKVQTEGLRALCAINLVPEFLISSKKSSTFVILKKTKKLLQNALKTDKHDPYDRTDLEDLLADHLWNNEKCSIS